MTFALYELALNPDIQEVLREDIRSTLEKYDNKLTYEAMLDMKYLQMVIDGKPKSFLESLSIQTSCYPQQKPSESIHQSMI